jgi:hypothetical protein
MRGTVGYMTVRQLCPQDMQTLSIFVRTCNDSVLPVTLTPLAEAWTWILVSVLCVYIYIGCDVLKKDEDVLGRTRDQRRVCGAGGRRDDLSLWHVSVRVSYDRALHCASKLHDGCIGS